MYVQCSTSPAFGYTMETRLAFMECEDWPLTVIVQGKLKTTSEQSGSHNPVLGSRVSPLPLRPNSTTRVLTGVTIGICSVSVAGTWLRSGVVAKCVTPGTSTLATEPTTRNCSMAPSTGSLSSPRKAWDSDTAPSGLLPLVCFRRLT